MTKSLVRRCDQTVAKRQAAKKAKFLRALSALPSVKRACQLSGIDRTTCYKWRNADAEFAAKWKEALDASVDEVEAKAFQFALCDTDPATATARVRLWEFILRSHRPDPYRERQEIGVLGGFIHVPFKEDKEP